MCFQQSAIIYYRVEYQSRLTEEALSRGPRENAAVAAPRLLVVAEDGIAVPT